MARPFTQALEGRTNGGIVRPPFQGLDGFVARIPRPVAWAGVEARRWRCKTRRVGHGFNDGDAPQILDGIKNHLLDGVGFVEAH
jgi:hypothetical protein